MANTISIDKEQGRAERYVSLMPQIQSLISGEKNTIANLANIAAALKTVFDFHWVGFYWLEDNELVLGPFQGPVACTRIAIGHGVCGKAVEQKRSIIVKDVSQFKDHIACSAESNSEIVVPIIKSGEVLGVLDIDSDRLHDFDETDQLYLEKLVQLLIESIDQN